MTSNLLSTRRTLTPPLAHDQVSFFMPLLLAQSFPIAALLRFFQQIMLFVRGCPDLSMPVAPSTKSGQSKLSPDVAKSPLRTGAKLSLAANHYSVTHGS